MRNKLTVLGMWILLIVLSSCSSQITDSCDTGDQNYEGTLTEIQANVFTPYCVGCHGDVQPSGNLSLTASSAYTNLVNNGSVGSSLMLVKPGDVSNSYLMKRLKAEDGEGPMPPAGKLSQDLIDLVALWVQGGAADN